MGAEFIRRAARTFKKRWDHGRRLLATADIFTIQPEHAATSAPFELAGTRILCSGDIVTVEKSGDTLVARCGLAEVARNVQPPEELLSAVDRSCGIAKGTVEQVHVVAGVVEISLC